MLRVLKWAGGALLLLGLVLVFDPRAITASLFAVPPWALAAWIGLTLASRLVGALITAIPVRVLGGRISVLESFSLGWVRTFLNQVVPASGLAFSAGFIRDRAALSWGHVAALATPHYIYAAVAVGIFGILATSYHLADLGMAGVLLLTFFTLMLSLPTILSFCGGKLLIKIPRRVLWRIETTLEGVSLFQRTRGLRLRIIALHLTSFGLRALRLWLLFAVLAGSVNFMDVALMAALGELAFVIQLTPGGLGVREGLLVGSSLLLGIDADDAAAVALLDRIFVVGVIALFSPLAFLHLSQHAKRPAIEPTRV